MRRLSTAALLFLLAFPAAAQLQQGIALFDQGRYEEARKTLAPLKNDAQAQYYLGRIAMVQDETDPAVDAMERAVALKPNVAEYHFRLGEAYGNATMKAGVFKQMSLARKTKAEFERAVALDPNHVDARMGLVQYYFMAPGLMGGDEEKGLREAAEIKKRDALMGHRAYAFIYSRQKKMDLARKEYVDAVREQPNSPPAHVQLGTFYANVDKNVKGAFEEIDTALRVDPNYMPGYFWLGYLAAETGANLNRGEEALKKYLVHTRKSGEPGFASTNYYLGLIYEKQGKKAEARQYLAAAVKMNPKSARFNEALKRVSM